jgi:hypothetical protein
MGCISGGREDRRRRRIRWLHGDRKSFLVVEERSTVVIGWASREKGSAKMSLKSRTDYDWMEGWRWEELRGVVMVESSREREI